MFTVSFVFKRHSVNCRCLYFGYNAVLPLRNNKAQTYWLDRSLKENQQGEEAEVKGSWKGVKSSCLLIVEEMLREEMPEWKIMRFAESLSWEDCSCWEVVGTNYFIHFSWERKCAVPLQMGHVSKWGLSRGDKSETQCEIGEAGLGSFTALWRKKDYSDAA